MPPLIPPARGGRAIPVKPRKPAAPKLPRVKPLDPNKVASDNAMSAFRTALAQLQQVTPQVDAGAIRAPYQAASVATGQLGTGLQAALAQSGQAAQTQYTQGLNAAQQAAAQFGISAGAGANPTALQNNGSALIAQQSQAQQAAAPQAATAWQQLLERTAAAKVADAGLQRQNLIASGTASLAGNIPSAINAEKQLGFQQQTQRENMGLARSQLTAKQIADLQDYTLGAAKARTSASSAATSADIKRAALKQKTGNDAAKLRVSQESLALKKRTSAATAQGLKGVSAASKALGGASTKPGKKQVAKGWDVQARSIDPDTGAEGSVETIHVPDKRYAPKGYKLVKGASAATHYETVPTAGGSAGITRSVWDAQMRSLLAQNPGRTAEVKAFMGPRPKK